MADPAHAGPGEAGLSRQGRSCVQVFSSSIRGRRRPARSSSTPTGRPSRTLLKRSANFPRAGWVARDPDSLWCSAVPNARDALRRSALRAGRLGRVAHQRKTVLISDRTTGQPIGNAIVWQDGRTACAEASKQLSASGDGGWAHSTGSENREIPEQAVSRRRSPCGSGRWRR